MNLSECIDDLAGVVYSQENIERANEYLSTRKIDAQRLSIPWAATSADVTPFNSFRKWIPIKALTNYLYIPIPDMRDQTNSTLAGFDLRYIGPPNENAIRYHKFKRDASVHLIYGLDTLWTDERDYVIVTEGAIDAQTLRQAGYPAIAPLTSLQSITWFSFLVALAERVFLGYDSDDGGRRAMRKLESYAGLNSDIQKRFKSLLIHGQFKDWNAALEKEGPEYIKWMIDQQVLV